MTSGNLQHLFTPLKIKDVTVRNRILMTGHGTLMAAGGVPTEQLINYYVEKAKGGCGMLVSEFASVHPGYTSVLNGYNREYIPEYQILTLTLPLQKKY